MRVGVAVVEASSASQVVQYGRNVFMIDCGEGSQLQLRRFKLPFARLRHIFISHLHGDHFLGLPGCCRLSRSMMPADTCTYIASPRALSC